MFFVIQAFILLISVSVFAISTDEFQNNSSAHILRNMQRIYQTLTNPDFIQKFPEYNGLRLQIDKVLEAASQHDFNKRDLPPNHPMIKELTELYGISQYDPKVDHKTAERIRIVSNTSTTMDEIHENAAIEKKIKGKENQKLMKYLLTMIFDKHDAQSSFRQNEMRGDGSGAKKGVLTSEWLLNPPGKNEKSIVTPDLSRKVEIAKWVEAFEDKYENLNVSGKMVKEKGFAHFANKIISDSRISMNAAKFKKFTHSTLNATGQLMNKVGKTASLVSAIDIADESAKRSVNPDYRTSFFSETAKCQTIQCSLFESKCKEQKKDEDDCVNEFFSQPLHIQYKSRIGDDLNILLNKFSLNVLNLECSQTNAEAKIETVTLFLQTDSNTARKQKIYYDSNGLISKIEIWDPTYEIIKERVFFNNGQPNTVQRCGYDRSDKEAKRCKSFVAKDVLYRGQNSPGAFSAMKLVSKQISSGKDNIRDCCLDNSCLVAFKNASKSSSSRGQLTDQ